MGKIKAALGGVAAYEVAKKTHEHHEKKHDGDKHAKEHKSDEHHHITSHIPGLH